MTISIRDRKLLSNACTKQIENCLPGYLLFNDGCIESCPEGYFMVEKSAKLDEQSNTSVVCNRCHYSCKHCFGSNDNECSQCFSDATLHRNGHCFAKELVQEVMALEKWYTAVAVVFLCLCFVILTLVVYIITDKNANILCCLTPSAHRTPVYDGLPLKSHHSVVLSTDPLKGKRNKYQIEDISEEDL
ncbi:unnamed protein product [Oppiella nova]|uniref:Furin-like cysteine-rich domain-containing protein n=1 Tax=Oppiella nova TaxID=334625 RepID=A0A7R9M8W5_9ACAR|nr:unnamed protein product [Oppiella nova]CAG2171642.1 unnamed protein product [Oppiella nova]